MDFKKMLEYNSPKNVHKRLMAFNIVQKIILLGTLGVFTEVYVKNGFKEMWYFGIAILAIYLFQSKK
tara:strand:+ start:922 stop:1122 length:201 start_codon:yes stop_codon:yes gene_type:complete